MEAYRTYITLTEPGKVTLTNIPFQSGQRVEVLVISSSEENIAPAQALRSLLKETQSLPHIHTMTEDEVLAEVAAYRNAL